MPSLQYEPGDGVDIGVGVGVDATKAGVVVDVARGKGGIVGVALYVGSVRVEPRAGIAAAGLGVGVAVGVGVSVVGVGVVVVDGVGIEPGSGFSSNLIFLSRPPEAIYLPSREIETDLISSLVSYFHTNLEFVRFLSNK